MTSRIIIFLLIIGTLKLNCNFFYRDQSHNKEIKRIKLDKKPPHAVSNRALSNVVNTLNKPVELSTESQEDAEEQADDSEK
jgi:hypothetical protein